MHELAKNAVDTNETASIEWSKSDCRTHRLFKV